MAHYRLLMIFSTIGPGAAKVVTSYLNLPHASITLCSVISCVSILNMSHLLRLHILGTSEDGYTPRMSWFFKTDYLDYL